MNALVGEKVAIVSEKPQTTRNKILGVVTHEHDQMVFVDTPGIHHPRTKLGTCMMQSVRDAMDGMDCLMVLSDVSRFGDEDLRFIQEMDRGSIPRLLILNKTDLIDRERLLEIMGRTAELQYTEIIPISAKTGDGLDDLTRTIASNLPEGPKYFPDDTMTDQPERLLVAEIIREKALIHLRDEVPHGIGVEILAMTRLRESLMEIHANIYCERSAHKGIIIGKHGKMLQTLGTEARADIERLLGEHVSLKLWVKVREDWRNRPEDLKNLGYTD